jgi:cobalt-zinc-cadmium efflux system outer membrane protein
MLFAAALAAATPAVASDMATAHPPSEVLHLDALLEAAREQNPELESARHRARAAGQVPVRVSAYDDPTFEYEAFNTPESLRVDRSDNNIFKLSQKFPFPGKLRLTGEMARRDAEMAERDADTVELDVLASVKRAYFTLWQAEQNRAIYERDHDLVERFARVAAQRYALGEATQPDVLKAQVEVTRLVNRVATEQLTIESDRAELAALLSKEPGDVPGSPEEPPPPDLSESPESLTELAFSRRPELKAIEAAIQREATGRDLAHKGYYPDFEFKIERFVNYGRNDGFGAVASVTIPLAYKYKYDAAVAEAEEKLSSAQAELRRQRDKVRREVLQALLHARAALAQRDLFLTTHIPQSEQALQAAEISYQTGKTDFLTLIDSVRAIESIHLEHVAASAELERAFADLERAVGEERPRLGGEHAMAATSPRSSTP